MKKILIGVGALVVLVVVAVVFVIGNLDSIIKGVIEDAGSKVTKVDVSLDGVKTDLMAGNVALTGLVVDNPSGYNTDNAISLGGISVTLDTENSTDKLIVIKDVTVSAPAVTYELGGAAGSNIDQIKQNVASQSGGGGSSDSGGGDGPKVIIDKLSILDGKVKVGGGPLGDTTMDAPLPNIVLRDIGKDKGGASPADVATKVLNSIVKGAGSAVTSLNLDSVIKGLGNVGGAVGDTVGGAAGAVGDTVGGAASGIGGAAGGLFGK